MLCEAAEAYFMLKGQLLRVYIYHLVLLQKTRKRSLKRARIDGIHRRKINLFQGNMLMFLSTSQSIMETSHSDVPMHLAKFRISSTRLDLLMIGIIFSLQDELLYT